MSRRTNKSDVGRLRTTPSEHLRREGREGSKGIKKEFLGLCLGSSTLQADVIMLGSSFGVRRPSGDILR